MRVLCPSSPRVPPALGRLDSDHFLAHVEIELDSPHRPYAGDQKRQQHYPRLVSELGLHPVARIGVGVGVGSEGGEYSQCEEQCLERVPGIMCLIGGVWCEWEPTSTMMNVIHSLLVVGDGRAESMVGWLLMKDSECAQSV